MEILIHDKKALKAVDTKLYKGWAVADEIKVIEKAPRFTWKGTKIPFELWAQIVTFLRWTQKTHKAEALMTFFYKADTGEWAVWPFPQRPSGMTINFLTSHPMFAEDRKRFGRDWMQAGTIHHHCAVGAFQSSTDKNDEEDRDGVHITLGKMDDATLDLHIRQTFDGVMGETSALHWVDSPAYLKDTPNYMIYDFTMHAIKTVRDVPYPKEWEDRIITNYYPNGNHAGFQQGHQHQHQTPRQTTILTGGVTEAGKKTREGSTSGPGGATSYEEWTQRTCGAICDELGITLVDAYCYLKGQPTTGTTWTDQDRVMKQALMDALKKKTIAPLHAESMLENLIHQVCAHHG